MQVTSDARTRLFGEGAGATMVTAPAWAWLLTVAEPMTAEGFTGSPYLLPAGVTQLSEPTDAVVRIVGGMIVESHQILKV
ncbi:hypothetical protein [Yimella sp. cx-51]|uniref:hypothetical protein n=1 Tax=Yimella sp. cx-51 TaxID=2770551 RepID=UPI00165D3369|nr:hypothetical protein [Yimella sp. cx-51]MBC9956548.1 hypothetical protein [Yimella sp. cx-51]QTH38348.1 hypothetical protein J5M86_01265 [Yimella sp. cx-51]